MTDAERVVKALREMDASAVVKPWTLATTVDRGEHARTPIGLVGGCVIAGQPHHDCEGDDEAVACVVVEFGTIYRNDSRKPPLHPDNAKEMATARAIVAIRNAIPALADFVEAADESANADREAAESCVKAAGVLCCCCGGKPRGAVCLTGKRISHYDAALARLREVLE